MRRLRLHTQTALAALSIAAVLGTQAARASDEPATPSLKNPEIIPESKVAPVYPPQARAEGVGGTVTLRATILEDGSVGDIAVEKILMRLADGREKELKSSRPGQDFDLPQAALTAVRQWKYKPGEWEGRPVSVRIGVVVEFVPDGGATGQVEETLYCGMDGVTTPDIIPESRKTPGYPSGARKERIQARLILLPLILKTGEVTDVQVLRAIVALPDRRKLDFVQPESEADEYGFAEAARAAVSKWRYAPCRKDGKAVEARFTIVVDFVLEPGETGGKSVFSEARPIEDSSFGRSGL